MKTFCILHLSDLHINYSDDPIFRKVREKLIVDLVETVRRNNLVIDAVAMTGDAIDKGTIDSYPISYKFLSDLASSLNVDRGKILFVPGNHDIPRPLPPIRMFLEQGGLSGINTESDFAKNWHLFGDRFLDYKNFVKELTGTEIMDDLYGGDLRVIESQNGRIKFFLVNSSWTSFGNEDYQKLKIGRWQLEQLAKKGDDAGQADLTIAMIHHPLDWLSPEEKSMTEEFLRESSIDVVLHGHIHDRSINFTGNPDGTIFSLVTGIGYPQRQESVNGAPKISDCRYSIYKFDVESGRVDIWLRSSLDNGDFGADTKLYSAAKEDGHFSMAYKSIEAFRSVVPNVENFEMDRMPAIVNWVGRDDELKTLSNDQLRVVAISGMGGQGKSFLAAEFLRRHTRGPSSRFEIGAWLDCRELDSLHAKVIKLLEKLSGGLEAAELYQEEKLVDTADRFVRHLKDQKSLVVFDNVDAYVQEDNEMVTDELRPFFEAVLNNKHNSLVLFTCRNPLNDSRAVFCHIPLAGLGPDEGIEFFRARGIALTGANSEEYARGVIKLTKGHPWWLGLIAGQVASHGQDSFKQCIERAKQGGEVTVRGQIKTYFDTVWANLNKDKQKLLRHLVEAPRPLLLEEIIHIVDGGPEKTRKTTNRLVRLGLLACHEVSKEGEMAYQVHPLVREFTHEKFSLSQQKPYVKRVLYAFVPDRLAAALFESMSAIFALTFIKIKTIDLIDAIETCLNSRNYNEALWLLEVYQEYLNDAGYYHAFASIINRTLESVDWRAQKIVNRGSGQFVLDRAIRSTLLMGDKRSDSFLRKYEKLVNPNSVEQMAYLQLAAHVHWQRGEYSESIRLLDMYDALALRSGIEVKVHLKHIRALALRDMGNLQEALDLFVDIGPSQYGEGSYYGNVGRCKQGLGRTNEAIDFLRMSLQSLLGQENYNDKVNTGYAYLWLCEIMLVEGNLRNAEAFYLLAHHVWSDFAKSLLPLLNDVESQFTEKSPPGMTLDEARQIQFTFLSLNESLRHQV